MHSQARGSILSRMGSTEKDDLAAIGKWIYAPCSKHVLKKELYTKQLIATFKHNYSFISI